MDDLGSFAEYTRSVGSRVNRRQVMIYDFSCYG